MIIANAQARQHGSEFLHAPLVPRATDDECFCRLDGSRLPKIARSLAIQGRGTCGLLRLIDFGGRIQCGRIDRFLGLTMSAHNPLEGAGGDAFGVGALSVPERFDGFIHEQYGELLRFLRRRTNGSQEAEDVAQESLLKLLRYRESAPISDWRRLLYRIAINSAHDLFRDSRRQRAKAQAMAEDGRAVASEREPDEFTAYQQRLTRLREAILQLPPKRQRVCLLRFAQGMTNAQIARRCDVSVKTVEKHLTKGLAALRRKVGYSAMDPFK